MKNKKVLFLVLGITAVFIFGAAWIVRMYEGYAGALDRYFVTMEDFKTYVIQNVAAYEDYAGPEIERQLRTRLLMDHLKIAVDQKYEAMKNTGEMEKLAREGKLEYVETGAQYSYYFYNVPRQYRYLREFTKNGLELVAQTFAEKLFEKSAAGQAANVSGLKKNFKVKFAISSAARPVEYQNNLRGRNDNASVESTHSYGISFDIFYDDFYISSAQDTGTFKGGQFDIIRRRHGFAMGGALRRQFQTVLSKTLLELQRQNKLYAIFEPNQKCYHVTILP